MVEVPQKEIIETNENFIESYATAAAVNLLNDGSIAIEFLKPEVSLVITPEGRVGYEGKYVSIARVIMSRETAKRLLTDLYNLITTYESSAQPEEEEVKDAESSQ